MSSQIQFDEETSRRVGATYQTPDVIEQRRELLRVLDLRPGESVVDVGSGRGLLACEMGAAVGPSGRVAGIDTSESMLRMSRSRGANQSWVDT